MKAVILFLFSLFLITITLNSCLGIHSNVVKEIPVENGSYNVYFCYNIDCGKIFAEVINSASDSVDCAFYNLKLDSVIDALSLKSRDVPVRLVLEIKNYNESISGKNVRIAKRDEWGVMHNKFCVVDGDKVVAGSYNPAYISQKYDNNLIVVNSKLVALNYMDEFEELWMNKLGGGTKVKNPIIHLSDKKVENFFCPEDNCYEKIRDLVRGAEKNIYFMTYVFTNENLADELLLKKNIDIRGVVESQQANNKYSQYKRLRDFGLDVKPDKNKYLMHHKVFIIDNKVVASGSPNPSVNGYERNDENILIIYDEGLALQYLEEFKRLYE